MQLHKANAPRFLKSNRYTPNKLRVQNFNVLPFPNRQIMKQKQRNGRANQIKSKIPNQQNGKKIQQTKFLLYNEGNPRRGDV